MADRPVVIVGVGALGSHVAMFARNWKNALRVIDFDTVKAKNTLAQVYGRPTIRETKARALAQTFQYLWGIQVEALPRRLTRDNVSQLLGGAALVLDCTDNIETRLLIQGFVRLHGIPCLHGALSADGVFARVVWDDLYVPDSEGVVGAPTCEGGEALPFFGMVGGWMAGVAKAFLDSGARASYQLTPTGVVRLG